MNPINPRFYLHFHKYNRLLYFTFLLLHIIHSIRFTTEQLKIHKTNVGKTRWHSIIGEEGSERAHEIPRPCSPPFRPIYRLFS